MMRRILVQGGRTAQVKGTLEIELTSLERFNLRTSSKVLNLSRVLRNGHVVTASPRP
jgi:hypothetical protein